jgi:hypothetical protein
MLDGRETAAPDRGEGHGLTPVPASAAVDSGPACRVCGDVVEPARTRLGALTCTGCAGSVPRPR